MRKLILGLLLMMSTSLFAQNVDLAGLIQKAKTQGATWTEAQWKDTFKEVMKAFVPIMAEATSLQQKAQKAMDAGDEEGAAKFIEEVENLGNKYKDVQELIDEFDTICEGNEIASKLNQDDEFQKEVLKELGMEDLLTLDIIDKELNDDDENVAPADDLPVVIGDTSGSPELAKLIEKAKAEGGTWNEEQWKKAFREAISHMAPMMKEISSLSKKAEALGDKEDVAAMLKLQKEAEAIQAKFGGVAKQIEEFGKVAESFEIGKKLSNDDELEKEIFKEFGLDELMGGDE
ncbi:MAG: hypothetical protein IKX36_11255 [Prevotella sp.]|nr:hypothetical protein [Prevotella sp.]